MPRFCAAIGCLNSSSKEWCRQKRISFHSFPIKDKLLLQRWLVNVRRANFYPTRTTPLCSEHFKEEDFEYQPFTNRRELKKGAIPTIFSYKPTKRSRKKKLEQSNTKDNCDSFKKNEESNSTESEFINSDIEADEFNDVDSDVLLDISMNERFYPPQQAKLLTFLSKPSSFKRKCTIDGIEDKKILAMKEKLAVQIVLRTLKKQLLDAKIKAVNAKRDYYETKRATLSKMYYVDSLDNSFESSEVLKNIRSRLKEEKLSSKIEERVLQKQLEEAEIIANNCEREYYKAKAEVILDSDDD
ncbi:uncharacterized protein CDAR_477901 [Caerostris darwini]|uniref:THAP-type domain-containing protein n=1 Tax=Caerostris darwini TaxID=1538125 RepID=A0AAV4MBC8_9ARAC|nr:uncharacterized protein CDAR_477901 [Caerostris darwini]